MKRFFNYQIRLSFTVSELLGIVALVAVIDLILAGSSRLAVLLPSAGR